MTEFEDREIVLSHMMDYLESCVERKMLIFGLSYEDAANQLMQEISCRESYGGDA